MCEIGNIFFAFSLTFSFDNNHITQQYIVILFSFSEQLRAFLSHLFWISLPS